MKTAEQNQELIILGGTSDLARTKLFPALFALYQHHHLPKGVTIKAVVRQSLTLEAFAALLKPHCIVTGHEREFSDFTQLIHLVCVNFDEPHQFNHLKNALNFQAQHVFYYAVAPELYIHLTDCLHQLQLIQANTRVVIEKPLGRDLASAETINRQLAACFSETQIYRIDHYLGKEAVQNLLALRFGNSVFEPLWCADRIESIQITVAEESGVSDRAEYYDQSGALRDMVQNHLLQLLCMVTMEPPSRLKPSAVRAEKLKILESLKTIYPNEVIHQTARGQYGVDPENPKIIAYAKEQGVAEYSTTETFAALRVEIDNWRWAGMPIYLRTGKRLKSRHSEVLIQFRDVPMHLFKRSGGHSHMNRLVISLQPQEAIQFFVNAKTPGKGLGLHPIALNMDFCEYAQAHSWSAYERLLLDVLEGDLTLFLKAQEVEAAWRWIDPIIEGWENHMPKPEHYFSGSWGPASADQLIARDGFIWNNPAG